MTSNGISFLVFSEGSNDRATLFGILRSPIKFNSIGEKLLAMGSPLADELEYVVANGREKEPEQFFGVSPKMK